MRALTNGFALCATIALAGCFSPTEPDCSFRCLPAKQCPMDYACNLTDGYCHKTGSPPTETCPFGNATTADAGPDLVGTGGGDMPGADMVMSMSMEMGMPDMSMPDLVVPPPQPDATDTTLDLTGVTPPDQTDTSDMVAAPDLVVAPPDMTAPPADMTAPPADMTAPPADMTDCPAKLTIMNFASWCSVSVNGATSVTDSTQVVCVHDGTIPVTATAASSSFILGNWYGTSGDTGSGDPGTVAGGTSSTTVVVSGAKGCVSICCPFANGTGCTPGNACPP